MVLIFSIHFEPTTALVIQWLNKFNAQWVRINSISECAKQTEIEINSDGVLLKFKEGKFIVTQQTLSGIWYRRTENISELDFNKYFVPSISNILNSNLRNERNDIFNFFVSQLSNHKWINHPSKSSVNKLYQLKVAQDLSINIPSTLVSFNKESLLSFVLKHKMVISKPIHNFLMFSDDDGTYITYANLVNEYDLNKLPDIAFPCLLQNYIDKLYEIRSFYLRGKFYSMAIFSQSDEKTKIDFRRYNLKKMNRRVPYNLPKEVELKLHELMKRLQLNSGSFDLIYGTDKKYHFLEVNPVGQFGMVSTPCNYYLEKIMAEELMTNSL